MKSNSKITANFIVFSMVTCFAAFVRSGEHVGWQVSHSDRYASCIYDAGGVHAEMVECIDEEIDKNNTEIYSELAAAQGDTSISELWVALKKSQGAWDEYVKEKCEPYQALGGQRGALLTRNCMLEEVSFRNAFVRELLVEAQI